MIVIFFFLLVIFVSTSTPPTIEEESPLDLSSLDEYSPITEMFTIPVATAPSYRGLLDAIVESDRNGVSSEIIVEFLEASHTVVEDLQKLTTLSVMDNWARYSGHDLILVSTSSGWMNNPANRLLSSMLLKGVILIVTSFNSDNPSNFSSTVGFDQVCFARRKFIHRMMTDAVLSNDRRRNSFRASSRSIQAESNNFASKLHLFCPYQFGDFETRRLIVRLRIHHEQYENAIMSARGSASYGMRFGFRTSREHALDQAIVLFSNIVPLLHGIHVQFAGEFGDDHGGVTRDWFTEIFTQMHGRFIGTDDGYDRFRISKAEKKKFDPTVAYMVIGKIVGLAFLEGIGTGMRFPLLYISMLFDRDVCVEDIKLDDPALHKSLQWLLDASENDLEGVEMDIPSRNESVQVTLENREMLIHQKLNSVRAIEFDHFMSFRDGFYDVVPPFVLRDHILSPFEVREMLLGEPGIDLADLISHTDVIGFNSTSPQIEWLWDILTEESSLRKFVRFVTGLTQPPLGGFGKLDRKITLAKISRERPDASLPSAHTCVYQINLPEYSTREIMSQKLLYALDASPQMGFV